MSWWRKERVGGRHALWFKTQDGSKNGGKDALGQMLEEGEVHRWDVTGGKYKSSNEGGEDHEGKILAANGKRPHMLDEGGIFHQGRIVAASGKSHHMLDEGGIFH